MGTALPSTLTKAREFGICCSCGANTLAKRARGAAVGLGPRGRARRRRAPPANSLLPASPPCLQAGGSACALCGATKSTSWRRNIVHGCTICEWGPRSVVAAGAPSAASARPTSPPCTHAPPSCAGNACSCFLYRRVRGGQSSGSRGGSLSKAVSALGRQLLSAERNGQPRLAVSAQGAAHAGSRQAHVFDPWHLLCNGGGVISAEGRGGGVGQYPILQDCSARTRHDRPVTVHQQARWAPRCLVTGISSA